MTKLRSALSPSNIDACVFLAKNKMLRSARSVAGQELPVSSTTTRQQVTIDDDNDEETPALPILSDVESDIESDE